MKLEHKEPTFQEKQLTKESSTPETDMTEFWTQVWDLVVTEMEKKEKNRIIIRGLINLGK